jgi:hypothetical protein
MKKFYLTLLTLILIISSTVKGQYSDRQAGLRMGYRSGVFYQITHEAGNADIGYNAMLGFSNQGVQVTGLRIVYEKSLSTISPDLFFAWGYGGHVGFVNVYRPADPGDMYSFNRESFCPVIGADGWLAAEYRVQEIPLNISLNLKPFIEIAIPAYVRVMPFDLALSVSYVF